MIEIALEDGGNFSVQKAILRNASAYFEKALESHFKEGKDKRLRLPGCTTATFQIFLYWLCKAKLPDFDSYFRSVLASTKSNEAECDDVQVQLVRLWAMADLWILPELQNAATRALNIVLEVRCIAPAALKTALELLPSDALICKALLRDFAYSWDPDMNTLGMKGIEELGQTPGFFTAFTREMFSETGGVV
ncbi:hypothetical protein HII31_11693 [Pseudocercospora fuligena]|uniref:BTB domain-containing protein n=1 Tax=Pseudocercospora fuligena TaxID=685502 RepID=A0A8H6R9W8_9PEZI|nr:hypothetical protein HII31_11693 [Pseudocercospora fuligena]